MFTSLHLFMLFFTYLFGSMCRRPRMHRQNASTWSIHGMSITPSFLQPAGLEHQSNTKPCEKPRKCGIRIQASLDCDKRNWQENSSCWWMFGNYLQNGTEAGWSYDIICLAFFPECVARVPVSLWGAGVALCDIQTCFVTCRKSFFCGRRNTFATFSEDAWQFSWQAQHFGRVHRHLAWQAQNFRRVLLRVFCKSHWHGCVKWWQGANSVASVAFCEMCSKLTEASHETSNLRLQNLDVPTKTRRKTSILKLQRVKIGGRWGSLARNASPCEFKLQSLWPQALYRGFHFSQASPEMKSRSKIL